jgi:parallel beta-helix repeat protein
MQSILFIRKSLAVGIILLVIAGGIIPSFAQRDREKTSLLIVNGSIFYVGGSGPGNYSRIQDAINDSHMGDTVYVYNDSSPYYEHLVIQKSITLRGEEETSTEINGSLLDTSLDTVNVTGDHVTISGFYITNNHGYYYQAAVKGIGSYLTISNCIIQGNEWVGVYLVDASFCQLIECDLFDNLIAINLVHSKSNVIQNCRCHENADGITFFQSSDDNDLINCTCERNSFDSILIQQSSGNQITGCVCQNGYDGISLPYAPNTKMRNNTLANNYANFGIGSSSVSDFYCDIDSSNTINGEPMYYLVNQSNLLFDETMEIGFLGLVSCRNISVKNCDFSNNFEGMLVADTTNSTIENCSFRNNDGHGMYLISSQGNAVKNSAFRNSFWDGIFLYISSQNTIENCSYYGSQVGVNLGLSTKNTITKQTVEQCTVGISCDSSGSNLLKDNTMEQCGLQVSGDNPADYTNDVDTSNMVNGKPLYYYVNETNLTVPADAGQVILVSCTSCTVSSLNLSDASIGVELAYSSVNTIENNILEANRIAAIDLDGSGNNLNIIRKNTIRGNNYGIDIDASWSNYISENLFFGNALGISFDFSSFNVLFENDIQDGYYGMYFDHAFGNHISDNTIYNSSIFGLYLLSSSGNILTSNQMINCSLLVYGNSLAEYLNTADTSNVVNGKPLYYLTDQIGSTIPDDAGEVLLVNSSLCTIKNLNVNKGTVGITLAYSSDNIITGNIIKSQSVLAVDLSSGYNNNNTIQGNILQGNVYGFDIEFSKGNTIKQNTILSNDYGILVYNALSTSIQRNTLSRNNLGISIVQSSESAVHGNNIFRNYIDGLSVEACSVLARWNWWGTFSGPSVKGKGNGDQINVNKNGQVTYTPWRFLPVLFTGRLRSLLIFYVDLNFTRSVWESKKTPSFKTSQISSDNLDLYGMRNQRMKKQHVLQPKVFVERNFLVSNKSNLFS